MENLLQSSEALASAWLRKERRDKGKKDIEYFASYYLSHILQNKTPAFHVEIRKMLFEHTRLGIAAPRGFAKSTNVQLLYAIYCLLYNRNEDILSISQSNDMAEDWVRKIKFELEGNEKIKEDFGPLLRWGDKESKRWTASHLVIMEVDEKGNEKVFSQIRARGRGCQVRGLRPTKVFCDDLEDDELVRSEEQRSYLQKWFLGSLLNVLKMDQQLVFIGTILHPLSLIAQIINNKNPFEEWHTKKYKALSHDNKSLWEDRFSSEDLLKRKAEIGTYAFESEFQNNPIAADICLWKQEWVRKYKPSKELKFQRKFAAIDIAATESKKGDYTAITVFGETSDNKFYEIETMRGRWGTWEMVERIIDFYKKHRPERIGIEEQAAYHLLRPVLYREARSQGINNFKIEALSLGRYSDSEKKSKTPTDKKMRALSVIHFWENGQVYLKTEELIDEISIFPTGSHDDMVDAAVYCMRMFMKYGAKAEFIDAPEPKTPATSFEIKDGQMPNIVELDRLRYGNLGHDWRVGY